MKRRVLQCLRKPAGVTVAICALMLVVSCGVGDSNYGGGGGAPLATVETADWVSVTSAVQAPSGPVPNVAGVYGSLGVGAAGNLPGARSAATSWTDASGNLWLFGGNGIGSGAVDGYLNDLWKYNPITELWTWMSGSNTTGSPGVYGAENVPSADNVPGARSGAASWIDASGNLWLFGGADGAGNLNDLWKYDPLRGRWTWVSGSTTENAPGIYGAKGVAKDSNVPGAESGAVSWVDASGNFWLFGGAGSTGSISSLWKFSPSTGLWTWVGGSKDPDAPPVYGSQGLAAASNDPGARALASSWVDNSGDVWLFGGSSDLGSLNDLWTYSASTGQWTWVGGSNAPNATGVYATKGVAAAGNVPGARVSATSWTDVSGNFWLFGGAATNTSGAVAGYFNDLWTYSPSTGLWKWVAGSNAPDAPGSDVAPGTARSGNAPAARDAAASWVDAHGNFWLFGGMGTTGYLNDFWAY